MSGQPLPPLPKGYSGQPFWYSSLFNCGAFYKVPVERVMPYFEGSGVEPVVFGEMAVVTFNYQQYTGQFNFGTSVTQEVEFQILGVPCDRTEIVSDVTFEQYLMGEEQSKFIGNHRVWVPCDSPNAINAGVSLYGEPKFLTSFTIDTPSLNAPATRDWSFTTNDPDFESNKKTIFTCVIKTDGLSSRASGFSPITEYGTHPPGEKMIACRWNILGPMETYLLDSNQKDHVVLTYGDSQHQMKTDLQTLIGDSAPSAIRTFMSQPAAFNTRAYYP